MNIDRFVTTVVNNARSTVIRCAKTGRKVQKKKLSSCARMAGTVALLLAMEYFAAIDAGIKP
ncbi:hypothetical protein [Sphingomonas sp. Leaf10]|uniref:hypothetical protein n=1 Tax=Sphingomonas sp. Leaf10 TaxID=1735676 RepID=UPI0012E274A6|nr:hypothetical protein [Sphingomonas sp. Leaf10]